MLYCLVCVCVCARACVRVCLACCGTQVLMCVVEQVGLWIITTRCSSLQTSV